MIQTPLERRIQAMRAFCEERGTTLVEVRQRDNGRKISAVRNALYVNLIKQGLTLRTIGRLLCRDHKAVWNGARKHERDQARYTRAKNERKLVNGKRQRAGRSSAGSVGRLPKAVKEICSRHLGNEEAARPHVQ